MERNQGKSFKERFEIYEQLAIEYRKGGRSMCDVCTEYYQKTGFLPMRTSVWSHVKKLRERNNP